MKKFICIIIFFVLTLPLVTYANELDSVSLSQYEIEKHEVSEDEYIILEDAVSGNNDYKANRDGDFTCRAFVK